MLSAELKFTREKWPKGEFDGNRNYVQRSMTIVKTETSQSEKSKDGCLQ